MRSWTENELRWHKMRWMFLLNILTRHITVLPQSIFCKLPEAWFVVELAQGEESVFFKRLTTSSAFFYDTKNEWIGFGLSNVQPRQTDWVHKGLGPILSEWSDSSTYLALDTIFSIRSLGQGKKFKMATHLMTQWLLLVCFPSASRGHLCSVSESGDWLVSGLVSTSVSSMWLASASRHPGSARTARIQWRSLWSAETERGQRSEAAFSHWASACPCPESGC